mgnify:CR=1 FL=1
MTRHASFPPIVDQRTETLILGSLPGAASLRERRYYAHPRNQFWRLLGAVLGLELHDLDYEERLAALLERGYGLWDVVADAERDGSLDAAIRAARAHDLASLAGELPRLHTIAFNGGTAARIGVRQLESMAGRFRLLALPSSSPAHAVPFRDKLHRWQALRSQKSMNDSTGPPSVM